MNEIFHFTDTARLPFILRTGVLRPGANRIGGYPSPDFLWASTNPKGDATSSADNGEHYRTGKTRHVRFTMPVSAFWPWQQVRVRHPSWTAEQVQRLEAAARGKSSPSTWWCRSADLPLADCIAIDTRSYHDNRWRPLDPSTPVIDSTSDGHDHWLMMDIEGRTFGSQQVVLPGGPEAYRVRVGPVMRSAA